MLLSGQEPDDFDIDLKMVLPGEVVVALLPGSVETSRRIQDIELAWA